MHNLLTDPLITVQTETTGRQQLSLPGVLAACLRDEVTSFPALRPHQAPFWHCFLVQLGALALHRSSIHSLPEDADTWSELLRTLTPDDTDDAPWQLVVENGNRPAFLQPPEPEGIRYTGEAKTADELDLLIGQKNHDLKEEGLRQDRPEDWIFALVTKQTGDGFNGAGNYGIARMNGGSSSRFLMGLAPLNDPTDVPRPGARLRHDIQLLLETREQQLRENQDLNYPSTGGLALLWCVPWPLDEAQGLPLQHLDIWFIEVCRRIRLREGAGALRAETGTSKKPRVDAGKYNGAVGDPWAPVRVPEIKTMTLGEGDLNYERLSDLLFSGNWRLPFSLRGPKPKDGNDQWMLIVQAIGRGNSKTYGYHERMILLPETARRFTPSEQEILRLLSQQLISDIRELHRILRHAIAIAANDGRDDKPGKEDYGRARPWSLRLDALADREFFEALWALLHARLSGEEDGVEQARHDYLRHLIQAADGFLDQAALSTSASNFRHRALTRARRRFHGGIRNNFEWFHETEEVSNAVA